MIETPSSSETAKVTKKNYVKLTSSALVMVISLVVTLAVLSLLFGHTGNTSTSANDVCLRLFALNGDSRTNLCTPCSDFSHP